MRASRRVLGRAALILLAAALSLSLLLSEAEGFIVGIPQDFGSLGMISSAARRIGLGGARGVMMMAERGGRRGGRGASSFSGGGGRGGGGARGRGGARGGKNSMDTQKRDARDGMSRREYDTAVSIGGSSAKPQQLKKFLALAQVVNLVLLLHSSTQHGTLTACQPSSSSSSSSSSHFSLSHCDHNILNFSLLSLLSLLSLPSCFSSTHLCLEPTNQPHSPAQENVHDALNPQSMTRTRTMALSSTSSRWQEYRRIRSNEG